MKKRETRIAYMDLTDFVWELGEAKGGNDIYASVKDLLENKPCANECGYVKVKVLLEKVLKRDSHNFEDGEWTHEEKRRHYKDKIQKAKDRLTLYTNHLAKLDEDING